MFWCAQVDLSPLDVLFCLCPHRFLYECELKMNWQILVIERTTLFFIFDLSCKANVWERKYVCWTLQKLTSQPLSYTKNVLGRVLFEV